MDKKKSLIKKLKKFKHDIKHDISIDKVLLFGSFATGKTHKWSDVDLIIVSEFFKEMDFFERGAKMYNYWHLKKPVDFLCYTPDEFNRLRKQVTIVRQALEEGIEI